MNSSRFSLNIHILTILALTKEELISSEYLASSINVNPVLVRKELSLLKKVGYIGSKEGKNGGCYLAIAPEKIILSDLYKKVSDRSLINVVKNEPNLNCPIGIQIKNHLNSLFQDAENAFLEKLGCSSLKTFVQKFL